MALSSSIDFSMSADDVVTAAMRKIGVLVGSQVPTSAQSANCLMALNMLVKQLSAPPNPIAPGLKLWVRNTATMTADGAASIYTIESSGGDITLDVPPVGILSVLLRNSDNQDFPLTQLDSREWDALVDKGQNEGTPTMFFYDRQLTTGYIYLDCIISDTSTYPSLIVRYLRTLDDLDTEIDDVHFPQEWYRPLVYQLAIDIAHEFEKKITRDLRIDTKEAFALANAVAPEMSSEDYYFQPGLE